MIEKLSVDNINMYFYHHSHFEDCSLGLLRRDPLTYITLMPGTLQILLSLFSMSKCSVFVIRALCPRLKYQSSYNGSDTSPTRGGVLVDNTGGLRPNGESFSGCRYTKG